MHRRHSIGAANPDLFAPAAQSEPPPALYLRVVVERGLDAAGAKGSTAAATDGLTYASPDPDIQVGQRVLVPLGKNDKPAGGVVIAKGGPELLAGLAASRIKPIIRATDVRLPPALAPLAQWLAAYYICPLGMVLSTMLPAAVKQQTGKRSSLFITGISTPTAQDAGRAGDSPAFAPSAHSSPSAPAEEVAEPAKPGEAGSPRRLSKKARELLSNLQSLPTSTFPIEISALADLLALSTKAPLIRLIDAGLVIAESRPTVSARSSSSPRLREPIPPPSLTDDQSRIAADITAALGSFSVHLIRGVTGSGKTEVYIRLIDRALASGKTAIVLVPEIALTPQTAERFSDRFPAVAILHSGLTAAQRHREWARAASGEARVVVGARSAVFAPLENLGLIVVDEEHDTSYKQDQLPRYHARDVAIKRAQLEGCPVVLGSATPALESWANATGPSPRFRLHELRSRIGQARLPRVEVLDLMVERRLMRAAFTNQSGGAGVPPASVSTSSPCHRLTVSPSHSRPGLIGTTLMRALADTLTAGGQAIILLNRRGYSSYLCCSDQNCGWLLTCDNCDAAMVLHMDRDVPAGKLVKCHHCLAEQLIPHTCPLNNKPIIWLGGGTQRTEEELLTVLGPTHGLVENQTLKRVDSDSMRTARDYFDALARFGAGEIRVLVGTQMIAKGLDYPNVRLVGVVNADTALALPDFRSAERTFQLISQVAGRAGRGDQPGRVIIQSVQPHHPVITLAAEHDYPTFADSELAMRRQSRLPPATRMARIVTRDKKPDKAKSRASELAGFFNHARTTDAVASRDLVIRGPMPCPISRIASYWRFAVELTAPTAGTLQSLLTSARNAGLLKSDNTTAVDVDPVAMM